MQGPENFKGKKGAEDSGQCYHDYQRSMQTGFKIFDSALSIRDMQGYFA